MGGNAWLQYRFPISSIDIWADRMYLYNEVQRPAHRLYQAAYPASCGRTGNLRAVDDRRVGTPRLSAQPWNPLPDASCDGEQRLSDFARAARGACRQKALQGNQVRQAGACAGEGSRF